MTRHFDPRFRLRWAVLTAAIALLLGTQPGWSADVSYTARPISDAERAAIQAVLAFFETGPNAILTRLATDAPLRSTGSNQALDEIAVRMGPAEGSAWQLRTPGRSFEKRTDIALFTVEFASGIDDVILMHMKEEADGWAIKEIRCGVDPRTSRASAEEELQQLFQEVEDNALLWPTVSPGQKPPAALLGALLGAVLCALLWGLLRGSLQVSTPRVASRRRLVSVALLLTAGLLAAGCRLLPGGDKEGSKEERAHVELDTLALAPLLPLRRALTGGRGSGDTDRQEQISELVKELVGRLDAADLLSVAARAWHAQSLALQGNIGAASKVLEALPEPDQLPLIAILRARTDVARADKEAVRHYEHARRLGPDHDGLALEAALALANLGENDKVEDHVRGQVWMGSRDAAGFYYAAQFEAILDQMDKAEKLFQAGWEREPISRSELLSQPILAYIGIRPANFSLFHFGDAEEPKVGPSRPATRPLTLPERASARILGERLVIHLEDRSLDISGAGDLMPEGTELESAEARTQRHAAEALARFDELSLRLEGGLLQPSYRRAAGALANSLAEREEWADLIRFTEPLAADPVGAPPDLIKLRALALMRSKQSVPATNLLIGLAKSDIANRRRDPATFYQLGEMLVELRQYDLALRAMERASALTAFDFTGQRKKQIGLMKELEASKKSYESRHFLMIYPAGTGERYPRQLSWVLEAEWDRVKKWIPVPEGSPKVEIHLYPGREFLDAYSRSGGTVGGLYDGVVRVPLAEYESFHPELLRIYSHEVAHAMIDIATRDGAPSWFHEGLASHIEMHQREVNPMPDMHEAGRDLSFALLPPVFKSWSEPQLVELAYINAGWTLHYIEAKKGVAGIHQMLDAFRRGNDTNGAIKRVFGQSLEQFDHSFRDWAIREAPQVWPSDMVAYHQLFDELVRRDAANPVATKEAASVLQSGNVRNRRGLLEREMRKWHGDYTSASRPVKVALAKALPMLQGKAEGDVQGACRDLRSELDNLLGNRTALDPPVAEVKAQLTQAYRAFSDMTQDCRTREWQKMRKKMDLAVGYLGKAKVSLEPYGLAP